MPEFTGNRVILLSRGLVLILLAIFTVAQRASAEILENPSLAIQPAEATSIASKAMILSATRAGERIVAVGAHGVILLSDGETGGFRQARSVPVRSQLTSVCFVDDKTGWAVGHWGVVIKTEDGGESWKLMRSDISSDRPLFSVYFKDGLHGYAVGLWSLLLTTDDGGATWKDVQLNASPENGRADLNLFKIFPGRNGAIIVAAESGTVLKSDNGSTWSYLSTGYKGSFWTGITLENGTIVVGGLRGNIYRSIDNGKTWLEIQTGIKNSITDFVEVAGIVHGVGLDGAVVESRDGGATFKVKSLTERASLTSVTSTKKGKLVAFSKHGVVSDFDPAESTQVLVK